MYFIKNFNSFKYYKKFLKKEIYITQNCNSGRNYEFGLNYLITCDYIRGIFIMFLYIRDRK